jgi:hypothetical protein
MKLLMTLVVRDEEEILETNIDYHLNQGVDFVIATNHGSRDRSGDILAHYARTGKALVIDDDAAGHHQSRRVSRMARLAFERYDADWLIHNDADEFWWPLLGSLRDVFAAMPPYYGQLEVPRSNFLPLRGSCELFQEVMVIRESESLNLVDGRLESKVAHRPAADVVVAPGNHWSAPRWC